MTAGRITEYHEPKRCDGCGASIDRDGAWVDVRISRGASPTFYVDLCDQCGLEFLPKVIHKAVGR